MNVSLPTTIDGMYDLTDEHLIVRREAVHEALLAIRRVGKLTMTTEQFEVSNYGELAEVLLAELNEIDGVVKTRNERRAKMSAKTQRALKASKVGFF